MTIYELVGKTIARIEKSDDDSEIRIVLDSGKQYWLYHQKDCCETVTVEKIVGNLDDLVGSPVTMALESTSNTNPPGMEKTDQDSFTWTFYKIATNKGVVEIWWYGESNGYYSEEVTFEEKKEVDY